MVDARRIRQLKKAVPGPGPVVYWMSRDQRVRDNWALIYAQELALTAERPLTVVFGLAPSFLGATLRHYGFMLQGLQEVAAALQVLKIPFFLAPGQPGQEIPRFVHTLAPHTLVTDFSPLRLPRQWKEAVAATITMPFVEVDAHNIVPCWVASSKQEYAAYTLRPKIHRLLPEFLTDLPPLRVHPITYLGPTQGIDWRRAQDNLRVDRAVPEVAWLESGEDAARQALERFLAAGLTGYRDARNDPTLDGQSNLSPYLHFGQIAPQRVAWEAQERHDEDPDLDAFLEELIVRRELADNFCFYNPDYDDFAGFPDWARKTLNDHRRDDREWVYSREEFDQGRTHDDLWNAAQSEMVYRGKMHGYLRMYWAKKILEWTTSPEEALAITIWLNDRYELDGRDPNGYVGAAWSIGGVHDRAWAERPIFGKIRYLSSNGCRRKFNVAAYIKQVKNLKKSAAT